jgi:hypothetical protein
MPERLSTTSLKKSSIFLQGLRSAIRKSSLLRDSSTFERIKAKSTFRADRFAIWSKPESLCISGPKGPLRETSLLSFRFSTPDLRGGHTRRGVYFCCPTWCEIAHPGLFLQYNILFLHCLHFTKVFSFRDHSYSGRIASSCAQLFKNIFGMAFRISSTWPFVFFIVEFIHRSTRWRCG